MVSLGVTFSRPGTSLPKLPELVLDGLPRTRVGSDSKRLSSPLADRAADFPSNGRLGQILHAYEQSKPPPFATSGRTLDPGAFRWLYYLGSVQASALQHPKAAATLREALKLEPKNVAARVQLGKSLLGSGELRGRRGALRVPVS